jgi:hypothetical protein
MKSLTNTLKTLITQHSLDILQQEQRLKAMLADLLPHDKQMRFLLELSLRAQIPQKLIAQQNDTRLGWEAQIKSLKHYFKDEYFLEDKAVNSVFDCWVEVLPRKKQAAAPPTLGNLNEDSRFKEIETYNWARRAFVFENSNWKPFFEKSNITNYRPFINDRGFIRSCNHIDSYPKLALPCSLLNEIGKQPPQKIKNDDVIIFNFEQRFQFTPKQLNIIDQLNKENKKVELSRYYDEIGFTKYINAKKKREQKEKEEKLILQINSDRSKTYSLEEFKELGSTIGLNFTLPIKPQYPYKPEKRKVDTTYMKDTQSITFNAILFLSAVISTIIFAFIEKNNGREWFLMMYAVFVFLYAFGTQSVFNADFWRTKNYSKRSYDKLEIERLENQSKAWHAQDLANYSKVLLPKFEKELKIYEETKDRQIKDLNEAFPLIARQMWLKAMVANTNVFSPGNSTNNGTLVKNLVARLGLQYPKYLKVNTKVFDIQSDIILNIDNKIYINIEIDEPYNRETRQETHFVGSNDEKRDSVFAKNNWFVLRFTESQVNYALSECISIVEELVQFTQSGNTQHLINLMQLSKGIETLCWSKEEARLMAMNED